MSTEIGFEYRYQGAQGFCSGVSFAQALDHAKLSFLKARGVTVSSPKFKIEKSRLRDAPFFLTLSPIYARRYQELYLAYREGQLHDAGLQTLADYQAIIKSKDEHNAKHKIGNYWPSNSKQGPRSSPSAA